MTRQVITTKIITGHSIHIPVGTIGDFIKRDGKYHMIVKFPNYNLMTIEKRGVEILKK